MDWLEEFWQGRHPQQIWFRSVREVEEFSRQRLPKVASHPMKELLYDNFPPHSSGEIPMYLRDGLEIDVRPAPLEAGRRGLCDVFLQL